MPFLGDRLQVQVLSLGPMQKPRNYVKWLGCAVFFVLYLSQ